MPASIKGTTVRIYLQEEELDVLLKLADLSGLAQTAIATTLVTSALRAIKADGLRIEYPLKFKVDRGCSGEKPARAMLPGSGSSE